MVSIQRVQYAQRSSPSVEARGLEIVAVARNFQRER
jgi:hypothetical protein